MAAHLWVLFLLMKSPSTAEIQSSRNQRRSNTPLTSLGDIRISAAVAPQQSPLLSPRLPSIPRRKSASTRGVVDASSTPARTDKLPPQTTTPTNSRIVRSSSLFLSSEEIENEEVGITDKTTRRVAEEESPAPRYDSDNETTKPVLSETAYNTTNTFSAPLLLIESNLSTGTNKMVWKRNQPRQNSHSKSQNSNSGSSNKYSSTTPTRKQTEESTPEIALQHADNLSRKKEPVGSGGTPSAGRSQHNQPQQQRQEQQQPIDAPSSSMLMFNDEPQDQFSLMWNSWESFDSSPVFGRDASEFDYESQEEVTATRLSHKGRGGSGITGEENDHYRFAETPQRLRQPYESTSSTITASTSPTTDPGDAPASLASSTPPQHVSERNRPRQQMHPTKTATSEAVTTHAGLSAPSPSRTSVNNASDLSHLLTPPVPEDRSERRRLAYERDRKSVV